MCNEMWDEYIKEYKVRGGVEMIGKGEPWHTKEVLNRSARDSKRVFSGVATGGGV